MKDFKEQIVDNDELLKFFNESAEEDESIKELKKDYPDKIKFLKEALLNYIGENALKILKTEFPDKWKFLFKEIAYPHEFFSCIDDYQKHVDNIKKEDFFSKLECEYPSDEEINRTKEFNKVFNIKNGEELTQLYLKSDVLLLTCVIEKIIKVSTIEFGINPVFCVGLPEYTWQSGLKYTGTNLQTLRYNDLILTLENNIRGGISSVLGDRYKKSDEKKRYYIWMLLI